MPDDENGEATYGLLFPFVACVSNGGPHEDEAFVGGYQCGRLDVELRIAAAAGADRIDRYVRAELVPQLDLIAMHHGFVLAATPWDDHPDEWTRVVFTRQPPEPEGDADA